MAFLLWTEKARQIILVPYKLYFFLESTKKAHSKGFEVVNYILMAFFVASDAFVGAEL